MRQCILIIDDAEDIHKLVKTILTDEDITIRSAYSAEEGLMMAFNSRPDLVLLDVDMPVTDGFEVCRRLRGDTRSCAADIIFLSSFSASMHKVRGFELEANDYITKPFDADEFGARIRRSLREKARHDETRSRRIDNFINRSLESRIVRQTLS